jgi:hypothetical protein
MKDIQTTLKLSLLFVWNRLPYSEYVCPVTCQNKDRKADEFRSNSPGKT